MHAGAPMMPPQQVMAVAQALSYFSFSISGIIMLPMADTVLDGALMAAEEGVQAQGIDSEAAGQVFDEAVGHVHDPAGDAAGGHQLTGQDEVGDGDESEAVQARDAQLSRHHRVHVGEQVHGDDGGAAQADADGDRQEDRCKQNQKQVSEKLRACYSSAVGGAPRKSLKRCSIYRTIISAQETGTQA